MKIPHNTFGNVILPLILTVISVTGAILFFSDIYEKGDGSFSWVGYLGGALAGIGSITFKVCYYHVMKEQDGN